MTTSQHRRTAADRLIDAATVGPLHREGVTASDYASQQGHGEIVHMLTTAQEDRS